MCPSCGSDDVWAVSPIACRCDVCGLTALDAVFDRAPVAQLVDWVFVAVAAIILGTLGGLLR